MTAELHAWNARCAAVIAETCHRVNIIEIFNQMLTWDEDRTQVSPGELLLGLIINLLVDRKAVYRLPEFFASMEMDILFPRRITAGQFNDDAVGRALDKLQEANGKKVLTAIALAVQKAFQIPLGSCHLDTTSKSAYGVYDTYDASSNAIEITEGFSKDHRPDLKQLMFGVGTTAEGVIVYGEVMSGNTSDKTWNGTAMEYVQGQWNPELIRQIVWVADSAFATLANMKQATDKNRHPRRTWSTAQ